LWPLWVPRHQHLLRRRQVAVKQPPHPCQPHFQPRHFALQVFFGHSLACCPRRAQVIRPRQQLQQGLLKV
jgi:hypothetical protein